MTDLGGGPAPDPAVRADQLRGDIAYHSDRYFLDDAPEIPDADFDALVRQLEAIEAAHPELRRADSPTQKVGGGISALFSPVKHRSAMMSLDKTTSYEELLAWGERMDRYIAGAVVYDCE